MCCNRGLNGGHGYFVIWFRFEPVTVRESKFSSFHLLSRYSASLLCAPTYSQEEASDVPLRQDFPLMLVQRRCCPSCNPPSHVVAKSITCPTNLILPHDRTLRVCNEMSDVSASPVLYCSCARLFSFRTTMLSCHQMLLRWCSGFLIVPKLDSC